MGVMIPLGHGGLRSLSASSFTCYYLFYSLQHLQSNKGKVVEIPHSYSITQSTNRIMILAQEYLGCLPNIKLIHDLHLCGFISAQILKNTMKG